MPLMRLALVIASLLGLAVIVLGGPREGDPCTSNNDCGWSGLGCVALSPGASTSPAQAAVEGTCRSSDESFASSSR